MPVAFAPDDPDVYLPHLTDSDSDDSTDSSDINGVDEGNILLRTSCSPLRDPPHERCVESGAFTIDATYDDSGGGVWDWAFPDEDRHTVESV